MKSKDSVFGRKDLIANDGTWTEIIILLPTNCTVRGNDFAAISTTTTNFPSAPRRLQR